MPVRSSEGELDRSPGTLRLPSQIFRPQRPLRFVPRKDFLIRLGLRAFRFHAAPDDNDAIQSPNCDDRRYHVMEFEMISKTEAPTNNIYHTFQSQDSIHRDYFANNRSIFNNLNVAIHPNGRSAAIAYDRWNDCPNQVGCNGRMGALRADYRFLGTRYFWLTTSNW